jgi:zinc transport system substrate-binding protein
MKIRHWAVLLSLLLVGCSGEKGAEPAGDPKGTERPIVYASNYPLQYFAEQISAPIIDVRLPVPAGGDPAFWKPTSEEILVLQQADLVLLNGASYESWLKNVSLPTSRLVDTSAGLSERLIAENETSTHSHGLDGEHEHSATAFTTWLDPTLAVEQARAIRVAFSSLWPEHAGQFDAQFAELAKQLQALDAEIIAITEASPDRPVVFSHSVYQYLVHRYGLNGRSLHWEPQEMPSEAMWQELTALLGSHPAQWMIWEGEPSPDITARLAELGIQSIVIDPCAGMPDSGDFASVMRSNSTALRKVYGRSEGVGPE